MCRKTSGRRRRLPIRMTIPHASGEHGVRSARNERSAACGENCREFLRRHYFKLRIRTVGRFLVVAPPAKMRHVPEAITLHVLVSDFDDQLRAQRLPREVLALAP